MTETPLSAQAKEFLAGRLHGSWDRDWLQVHDNDCLVEFDTDLDYDGGELWLFHIAVGVPGERLGTSIIELLREFSDQHGTGLLIGPCTNQEFWGITPHGGCRRFQWLQETGDDHGDPVLGYRGERP